ncbi:AAA family ATPase [Bosea sp. (in: a-proteobacteria)]|uniref:AAA family ATPase n=1 Tax=Bosea sp. (in: a-proteobacteria) TaxID=1871050 RepID=UPI003B3AFD6B
MKIKRVEISGLLDRPGVISSFFHDDLNILTGRNGSGKTSILKLIWYVMSGNIILALREVPFDYIILETTDYNLIIQRTGILTCKIEFNEINKTKYLFEDEEDSDGDIINSAEAQAEPIIVDYGSSVFFPTFRRIEGGFGLSSRRVRSSSISALGAVRAKSEIEDALSNLSKRLSNGTHTFVSAISTADIVGILLTRYANLSTSYNKIQQNVSDQIINRIRDYRSDESDINEVEAANAVLDEIKSEIEKMESQREIMMSPIEEVGKLVGSLFKKTGIDIGAPLRFGDAANAVNSELLSAGEKQMLSFICYNAFNEDSIVFVDEPELSLHVDWQRQLFPILMKQKASNQFIIATHSPFIYSKFPDKEISIDLDRGDGEI